MHLPLNADGILGELCLIPVSFTQIPLICHEDDLMPLILARAFLLYLLDNAKLTVQTILRQRDEIGDLAGHRQPQHEKIGGNPGLPEHFRLAQPGERQLIAIRQIFPHKPRQRLHPLHGTGQPDAGRFAPLGKLKKIVPQFW